MQLYAVFALSLLAISSMTVMSVYPPLKGIARNGLSKTKRPRLHKAKRVFNIVEAVGFFACFAVLTTFKQKFLSAEFNIYFVLLTACLVLDIAVYLRYFMSGHDLSRLLKPIMFFPYPVVTLPVLALFFTSIWINSALLAIFSAVFAAGHAFSFYIRLMRFS